MASDIPPLNFGLGLLSSPFVPSSPLRMTIRPSRPLPATKYGRRFPANSASVASARSNFPVRKRLIFPPLFQLLRATHYEFRWSAGTPTSRAHNFNSNAASPDNASRSSPTPTPDDLPPWVQKRLLVVRAAPRSSHEPRRHGAKILFASEIEPR